MKVPLKLTPAWKGSFELVKRELEMILEREILPPPPRVHDVQENDFGDE